MNGAAIRAGQAFVELVMRDEQVRKSLEQTKTRLRAFGAVVDSVGASSFRRMSAVTVASTAAAAGGVGLLATSMGVLRTSIFTVGIAFKRTFDLATVSVTRSAIALGGLAAVIAKFATNSKLATWFNKFLDISGSLEKAGRWTRLIGNLIGSNELRRLGNQAERLGLAASIVRGFQRGGVSGGIAATIAAGFRSAAGMVAGLAGTVFAAPFRVAYGLLKLPFKLAAAATKVATGGLIDLGGGRDSSESGGKKSNILGSFASGAVSTVGSVISTVTKQFRVATMAVTGFASAISGPALLSAKQFIGVCTDIIEESEKTGQSIQEVANQRFGSRGLISEADIRAGAALDSVMVQLKQATAALWAEIGVAALPVLKSMTENMTWAAQVAGRFLHSNRQLITTVVSVAAKVAAAGGAILAFTGFLATPLAPMAAIAAAVAGLIYAFPQLGTFAVSAFQRVWNFIKPFTADFGRMATVVKQTMAAMGKAVMDGDMQSAFKIMMAGVNLAWLEGSDQLQTVYRDMVGWIAKFGINAFTALRTGWTSTVQGFADAWDVTCNGFIDAWKRVQNAIANGMARITALMSGLSVKDVLADLEQQQEIERAMTQAGRDKRFGDRDRKARSDIDAAKRQAEEWKADVDQQTANRHMQALEELQRARQEFEQYKLEAEAEQTQKRETWSRVSAPGLAGGFSGEGLGTFSAAAVGRQSIGGIVMKTTENLLTDINKGIQDLNVAVGKQGVGLRFKLNFR